MYALNLVANTIRGIGVSKVEISKNNTKPNAIRNSTENDLNNAKKAATTR